MEPRFIRQPLPPQGLLAGDVSIHHYQGKIKNLRIRSGDQCRNGVGLQTIDYAYNVRGWLKRINTARCTWATTSLGLNSTTTPHKAPQRSMVQHPLYNGNISHVTWQTNNISTDQRPLHYKYDAMNRFTRAYYAENSQYTHKYNAYIYNYDRNGNIGICTEVVKIPITRTQVIQWTI